jgi:phosphocarrier protein HPr
MVTKEMTVEGKAGLESKPAALFIQKASTYKSSIWIERNERKANAKSLLGLLSLSSGNGAKIIITAEGEDEEIAVKELEEYINSL